MVCWVPSDGWVPPPVRPEGYVHNWYTGQIDERGMVTSRTSSRHWLIDLLNDVQVINSSLCNYQAINELSYQSVINCSTYSGQISVKYIYVYM